MLLDRIERMTAVDIPPRLTNRIGDNGLDALLGGPTFLIRGKAQIAASDQNDCIGHSKLLCHE
jgi:hypothetical protein